MTSFNGITPIHLSRHRDCYPSTTIVPITSTSLLDRDPPSAECLVLPVVASAPPNIDRTVHGSQPSP